MRRLALLAAALLALAACSGSDEAGQAPETAAPEPPATTTAPPAASEATDTEPAPAPEPEPEPEAEARPGVPDWTAGYRDWTQLNSAPIPPRASDPHNGTKNVFSSKPRRADGSFPNGTIVVKDARRPGTDFIGLIALMRKRAGFDPEHGDWFFVEYVRDSADEPFRELARDASCWSCHAGAAGDFVFTGG